jgi:hypothetical protein
MFLYNKKGLVEQFKHADTGVRDYVRGQCIKTAEAGR